MNITESKLHKLQRKLKTRRVRATMPSEPRKCATEQDCMGMPWCRFKNKNSCIKRELFG